MWSLKVPGKDLLQVLENRNGWLFNVSGLQAVEIFLRSGKKYRIGTDEPERLVEAIRANL